MLAESRMAESYEFRPSVVATVLDDGAVLLDLDTKYFYRLNRTGWAIAQLFETGSTLGDVLAFCKAIGAPDSDEDAISTLVATLVDDKLIDVSEKASGGGSAQDAMQITWTPPTIEKQAEPLQRVIISAFDPSVPLVE